MDDGDLAAAVAGELELLRPAVRADRARVEALLDPDFREIGSSGRLWGRAEIVAAMTAEAPGPAAVVTEVEAYPVGQDLVLVLYLAARPGRQTRRSSLWRRSADTWRVLFHQGTVVP